MLLVPVLTYLLSYLWLAVYHGTPMLWNVVVHENGRHTLLETTFYASHFFGHVPVLTVLALLFAAAYVAMAGDRTPTMARGGVLTVGAALGGLLLLAAVLSVIHFGVDETLSFALQRRQRPDLDTAGGSWKLHLPSTMLQFALIPVAVWMARRLCGRSVAWSRRGVGYLAAATGSAVVVTWIASPEPLGALAAVWRDPRYLAHSVRELATFPVTYYPIPLAFLLAAEARPKGPAEPDRRTALAVAVLLVFFAIGFSYQVVVSLAHDIGSLAQKPEFAKGGELGVSYLLASHYFEHFLDSIYFALVAVLLVWGAGTGAEAGAEAGEDCESEGDGVH